jgi:hypothetical protein
MYPSKQVKHITQQIDVRWGCKYEAVDVISERFDVVLTTLIDVANNPGESDEDSEDDEYGYTKSHAGRNSSWTVPQTDVRKIHCRFDNTS